MNQFYSEYIFWEDYNNGMYETRCNIEEEEQMIAKAISLLTNSNLFLTVCYDVVLFWDVATKINLTNVNCNRRAWLGQAACNYHYKVPEFITRKAWSKLSEAQRNEANQIADKIIKLFERNYEKKNRKLYKEMDNYSLFE